MILRVDDIFWLNEYDNIYNVGAYRTDQPGFTIHWQIYDPNKLQH